MYKMSSKVRGMKVVEVPLDASWDIPVAAFRHALGLVSPRLVFIASPNNPTGTMASPDRLEEVIDAAGDALVVIDEAYVDYASRDQLALYRERPNVAVMRTLSKIGFAALRVGWLIGHPTLVAGLDKVRQPYNVNGLSQRLAELVIDELDADVREVVRRVVAERERLAAAIEAIPGFRVAPREANFLWVSSERPAGDVKERLAKRGILVRSFHHVGGRLAHQLRITVGTQQENDSLLSALREVS
jgi:histidinol-phosphate aminotransferase